MILIPSSLRDRMEFFPPLFRKKIKKRVLSLFLQFFFLSFFFIKFLKPILQTFGRFTVRSILVASGVVITLCFGNLETVPYSKRTHVVLLPRTLEKLSGNYLFEWIKEEHLGKILAPDHPKSIRAQRISQAVFEAVKKGLLSNEHIVCSSNDDNRGIMVKKGKAKLKKNKPETADLESFNWEVIVVDKPVKINSGCLPGGKIVLYTGLLNEFEDDAEVAIIIGHEVGHAVARHKAEDLLEDLLKMLWSIVVKMILWQCMDPNLSSNISDILFTILAMLASDISDILYGLFVTLPFSRRNELEADYIGMLVAASAGYDPRVAPKVYEKLGEIRGSKKDDFLSTHPLGKKRAEKLSQAQVMEEALSLYRQAEVNQRVSWPTKQLVPIT